MTARPLLSVPVNVSVTPLMPRLACVLNAVGVGVVPHEVADGDHRGGRRVSKVEELGGDHPLIADTASGLRIIQENRPLVVASRKRQIVVGGVNRRLIRGTGTNTEIPGIEVRADIVFQFPNRQL